jgi:hypothetical protein
MLWKCDPDRIAFCLLLALAAGSSQTDAFVVPAGLGAVAVQGAMRRPCARRSAVQTLSAGAKTFSSKDFNVNWNRPDAQGTFGRVYFAKQGLMGMGGQVVVKFPVNNNFALSTFEAERVVNQRLDSVGSP